LSSERWEQAAAAFQAAITLDSLFVDAHYGLGQAYMGATRYASAVQAYTRCLDAARSIHGLRDRDRVAVDRQIDEEIRELRDAARRVASQANPQAVAMKVVQIEQRIQDRERSRSSNMGAFEPPAGVLLALGSAHFRNGARDEAEAHWTEAVRSDPKIGEAWNNLAVIYMQSSRKAEAEDAVERAERAGFRVNPRLKDDIRRMPAPLPVSGCNRCHGA
jgi:tetratricopeptide (TPR) repeat protein